MEFWDFSPLIFCGTDTNEGYFVSTEVMDFPVDLAFLPTVARRRPLVRSLKFLPPPFKLKSVRIVYGGVVRSLWPRGSSKETMSASDSSLAGSADAWELSKENIQPLRGGRRAASVSGGGLAVAANPATASLGPSAERLKEIRDKKRSESRCRLLVTEDITSFFLCITPSAILICKSVNERFLGFHIEL